MNLSMLKIIEQDMLKLLNKFTVVAISGILWREEIKIFFCWIVVLMQ